MSSVSLTTDLTACPSLWPEALAPHPSPSLPSGSGCHAADGAGSPSLSQAHTELPAQCKTPTWVPLLRAACGLSCSTALQGHFWRGGLGKTGSSNGLAAPYSQLIHFQLQSKVAEKLVLKTNLIASKSTFTSLHFLALILCIAVCVSEQNLIILHPYEPWWLHTTSIE